MAHGYDAALSPPVLICVRWSSETSVECEDNKSQHTNSISLCADAAVASLKSCVSVKAAEN